MQDLRDDYVANDHGNEAADPNANVQMSQTNFVNVEDLSKSNQSNPCINFVNLSIDNPLTPTSNPITPLAFNSIGVK
jgi:hypothetical protein